MALSGVQWVNQFPTSKSTVDLAQPFRGNVERFIAALRAAGAMVDVEATLRPPERAYLMHYSFRIAREGLDPSQVPGMTGVDIQWVHKDTSGTPDLTASRRAATAMVQAYGIAFKPALNSHHTRGIAIDMAIAWNGNLTITNGQGQSITITTLPHHGDNTTLHQVGASYGVIKLRSDPPHWSADGH